MKFFATIFPAVLLSLAIGSFCQGADLVGMERNRIIESFGEPSSAMKSSNREILNYAQGRIVIVEGKVSSFEGTFSLGDTPASVPVKERPPRPVVQTPLGETSEAPDMSRRSVEPFWWSHTLNEARKRSTEKNGRPILALFTGPDWCGPCQQLEAQVLNTDEFKRLGRKQYIPLKIALYMNAPQSAQAKEEYHRLSKEYGIQGVPGFVILNTEGRPIAKPDLFKRRSGVTNFKEQVLVAIEEAEKPGGGMHLYLKIGIGVAVSGFAFVFLRR